MRIIATEELSPLQQRAVRELEETVRIHEGLQRRLFLTNRLNADPALPCFYLGYMEDRLVSMLLTYFPTFEEVEVSGFTDPDYRNSGHFSLLLRRMLTEYAPHPFNHILLLAEEASESGKAYLALRAPTHLRSELILSLSKDAFEPKQAAGELIGVQHHNRTVAASLMSEIFGDSLEESHERLALMLLESGRTVFLYRYRNQTIGVLNAQRNEDASYSLYGVGIIEASRNRGFGTAMLQLALAELFTKTREVRLEVESTNEAALALYQKAGFAPTFALHFHRYREA